MISRVLLPKSEVNRGPSSTVAVSRHAEAAVALFIQSDNQIIIVNVARITYSCHYEVSPRKRSRYVYSSELDMD